MNTENTKNECINELVPYRVKNKWGFADRKKNIIIDCKYEGYKEGQANDFFQEKLAKVRLNNKYGFIDNTGKIVIPCTYDSAHTFSTSATVIGVNQKQGVISTSGEFVLPLSDMVILGFQNGYSVAGGSDGKCGTIDLLGNIIVPFIYDVIHIYDEIIIAYINDLGTYILDLEGKLLMPIKYDIINYLQEGFVSVEKGGKWGVINTKNGQLLNGFEFDFIGLFSNGIARVEKNNKIGFINNHGELIIPCIYDNANDYFDGIACVMLNDKFGYIDTFGNILINFIYEKCAHFIGEICLQEINSKKCLIDKNGKIFKIFSEDYKTILRYTGMLSKEEIKCIDNQYLIVWKEIDKNDYVGIIDFNENLCVPFKYDRISNIHEGLFMVYNKKNDFIGYADIHGNEYWEDNM